jgi:signal transduction histidine kinase
MIPRKTWTRTALWLGISWSIFWSAIFSDLFLIPHRHRWQNILLLHLHFARIPPPETLPEGLQFAIILIGGIDVSHWVMVRVRDRKTTLHGPTIKRLHYWLYPLLALIGLGLLHFAFLAQGWILPLALPLITWTVTGLSTLFCLQLGLQQDLIHQQRCEIDRLQTVEQAAVISQARKLMHRLASDIHDGPLQELKVIMDRLEILQSQFPEPPIDPILDQLATLGTHLRQHLSRTNAIALEITPELRNGLDQGIQTQLNNLIQSGELTLKVIQQLQPLTEPILNSLWLEAREDLYRFFKEAIHNVIHHAQPPYGSATQVIVSLKQQDHQAMLTIENDGTFLDPKIFEPNAQQRQKGGYGTKLMDTIAAELPDGKIQRIPLSSGGLQIQLTWNQNLSFN